METGNPSSNARNAQPHSENSADDCVTVGQRIDHICDAAQMVWKGSRDTVREFRGALDLGGRVDRNPYAMMAAAVGSGYVLGGGLFSPLTARIVGLGLRLGLRIAAIPCIQRELIGLGEAATDGTNRSGSPGRKP
jgi:hypothetical protein